MNDFAYLLAVIPNIAWWAIPLLLLAVFLRAPLCKGLVGKAKAGRPAEGELVEPPFETQAVHARHVRSPAAPMVETRLCPRCGSPMVLRISKQGNQAGQQFWGCSNFPECRGTIEAP